MLEFKYTRVVNMPKLHMVLCKMSFKNACERDLNMLEFHRVYWKGS